MTLESRRRIQRATWIRLVANLRETTVLAFDSLRASKLRSGLTVLGVVIGVSVVMAMASIVQGIRDQIVQTIEIAGPTTFYVMKVISQTPLNPDRLPKWVRVRPDLNRDEAERIAALPIIAYASIWAQVIQRVEFNGTRTQPQSIVGADDGFTEIQGGDLVAGRWFTHAELASGAAVVVLDVDVARQLFGSITPLDKLVRLGGRPARVVGVYQPAANIFKPPGQEVAGIVPFGMLDHQFTIDKTQQMYIPVKPRPGVTVVDAQEAVTIALREM
ncbi:MAG TPA: ABC transporter permease, partial [Gemmatimonadaceae bacterium]|nr:ABC transporter permease [Gemmatimonadaceae bacterium]